MTPSSPCSRPLVALATALATAFASVVLVAPPAQAAWQAVKSLHGARVQVCAVPAGSATRVRLRVDNRRSSHAHVGVLQTYDGRRNRQVQAAPGRLSGVGSLVVGRRTRVVAGISESGGTGVVSGVRRASRIPRC